VKILLANPEPSTHGPAVWKLKKSKPDENDILGFDFKIEWTCVLAAKAALNE